MLIVLLHPREWWWMLQGEHKMKLGLNHPRSVMCVVGVAFAMMPGNVQAQQKSRTADSGFSFDVYGDSRSMMYLPYKQSEEAEARKLMVDMFELVLPARVAPEVVAKD